MQLWPCNSSVMPMAVWDDPERHSCEPMASDATLKVLSESLRAGLQGQQPIADRWQSFTRLLYRAGQVSWPSLAIYLYDGSAEVG